MPLTWPHRAGSIVEPMRVGEVVQRSGVSRKALRVYEARGILPAPRRTASGYRVYPSDVLDLLRFVVRARRLGLTLSQIGEITAQRRDGSAPCAHVRALPEQKAAGLADLLNAVRAILDSGPKHQARHAAVCPHIDAKGGELGWNDSHSARPARHARRSSSTAMRSGSGRTPTRPFSRRPNGMSSLT